MSSRHGWFKAKASGGGSCCVEVNLDGDEVLIRDSKYVGDRVDQPVIRVSRPEWRSLLIAMRADHGRYRGDELIVEPEAGGLTRFRSGPVALHFNTGEMAAFRDGVKRREFDPAPIGA